uniref:Uncharacterized protein n=1 Tax=Arundo donax TaxID=35708 RepID=A0A0A9GHJ9_ARUDO
MGQMGYCSLGCQFEVGNVTPIDPGQAGSMSYDRPQVEIEDPLQSWKRKKKR